MNHSDTWISDKTPNLPTEQQVSTSKGTQQAEASSSHTVFSRRFTEILSFLLEDVELLKSNKHTRGR